MRHLPARSKGRPGIYLSGARRGSASACLDASRILAPACSASRCPRICSTGCRCYPGVRLTGCECCPDVCLAGCKCRPSVCLASSEVPGLSVVSNAKESEFPLARMPKCAHARLPGCPPARKPARKPACTASLWRRFPRITHFLDISVIFSVIRGIARRFASQSAPLVCRAARIVYISLKKYKSELVFLWHGHALRVPVVFLTQCRGAIFPE